MPAIILRMLIGLGLGAAAMYILDPQAGRRRRGRLRDRAMSARRRVGHAAQKAARDMGNRVRGGVAEARAMWRGEEEISDDVLAERIRARMGHVLPHAHVHLMEVSARGGHVTLRGTLPADEAARVVADVRSVRGVTDIDNQIRIH